MCRDLGRGGGGGDSGVDGVEVARASAVWRWLERRQCGGGSGAAVAASAEATTTVWDIGAGDGGVTSLPPQELFCVTGLLLLLWIKNGGGEGVVRALYSLGPLVPVGITNRN
jgi:hypothetical protein